jgi:molybdenum cofactor biosynthesis enzyme MoaA
MSPEAKGSMTLDRAKQIVDFWTGGGGTGLKNIRFSGGEPTLWRGLPALVKHTKAKPSIERIAISTNGSAKRDLYQILLDEGVDDFSISLDACCSSTADKMAGVGGKWETVVENIRFLSSKTYVTVGIVITPENIAEGLKTVELAAELGVSDIRVISSAQWDGKMTDFVDNNIGLMEKYPILHYRLMNMLKSRSVRGIEEEDNNACPLVLDDMCIAGNHHYPCIIYFREGGKAIGTVDRSIRTKRYDWYLKTDTHSDPICKKNCLDVCIDYNNKVRERYNG